MTTFVKTMQNTIEIAFVKVTTLKKNENDKDNCVDHHDITDN